MSAPSARPAEAAHVPQLVALMTEFYAESGYPLPAAAAARAFQQLIDAPALGQVWLLEYDEQPAGFVVLTVSYSMEYGGLRGFVDDFFVRPAVRGRGVGAAGLAALEEAARARGVRALLVETSAENTAALGVYRRAGYVVTDHLWLSRPLAPPVHEG